jgi:phosphoribosylaminoimidazolecarboxamide formyltransferase / IMP cyclohydrolase
MSNKKISSALISVFQKDGLDKIVELLKSQGVKIYSTGGTQSFLESKGCTVTPVEELTEYPSIFGGRVKTLHPVIFGGILYRREEDSDQQQAEEFKIPTIDLVIVDLYPFEETVQKSGSEQEIIEKIDIGGISLIRAAAKNFKDVLVVPSKNEYLDLEELMISGSGTTSLEQRKKFALRAFAVSSHYDSHIAEYFNRSFDEPLLRISELKSKALRYGENPHQKGVFYGDYDSIFEQLHGKEVSYNNLVDIDGAVGLIEEFEDTSIAIIKHTNACGMAQGNSPLEAYEKALAGDPVSAFGGVIASNKEIDEECAEKMNELFFEVVIAPNYSEAALEILKRKKNRILLKKKRKLSGKEIIKSALDGILWQEKDQVSDNETNMRDVTIRAASSEEKKALVFANLIAKHTKSNVIVIAREGQLLGSGVGQTSRVDAANQAIEKAKKFGFDLKGSVMASDAFFPFPDCVEIADKAGISAVIQPGGSIRDKESVEYCDKNGMAMVFTGNRHFKH